MDAGDEGKPTVPNRPSSKPTRADDRRPASNASPRYVGGEEIARGGMGRVIEATDTLLARTVAVKEALTDDPETLRRFARETRITARLEHPSIVPVYDAGSDPSAPFYVMRRVTGRPLSGLIASARSLDERLALIPHVLACAQAIAHAHRRGVIHRDIKPANILVGELGETVVIDWGIAKVIAEEDPDDPIPPMAGDSLRTRIGTVSGTPGFMSPEQSRGDELGPSADVWALGATLYYVLSRQLPHEVHAKTPDDLMAFAASRPVPPITTIVAGVPPELAAITARALAFAAADRFPDAATFAEELSRFSTGQIVASHRYSVRERLVRFVKKHRAIVAIAAIAIAVVGVVSSIAIGRVLAARERADASARIAEAARAREHAHAESELLARARAIATTNPTAAIAAIDELPATSPMVADANAIFATAISHGGAAWGLARNSGPIGALELDPTATKVLQLGQDGLLQIWDLDRRTRLVEKKLESYQYAAWTARGVLVYGRAAPQLIDGTTGQATALASRPLQSVTASEDGTRVAALDDAGAAGWLDLATGRLTPVASDHAIESIAIPDDGSWLATYGAQEIVVYDTAGAVVLRRPGSDPWLAASRSKRLAILERGRLLEAVVGPGAQWETLSTTDNVMWPEYFDEMLVARSPSTLYIFGGTPKAALPVRKIGGISASSGPAGSGMLAFTSGGTAHELVYFDAVRTLTIPLPEALTQPKIAARRGNTRVVVAGNAIVLVLDLAHVLPRKRTEVIGHKARFVTNADVLALENGGSWVLHRGPDTRATLGTLPAHAEFLSVSNDRVLLANVPYGANEMFVLDIPRMQVWGAKSDAAVLVEGGLVYVSEKKLYVRPDDKAEGHVVADMLDGTAMILADGAAFFAFSEREMLRGNVTAGITERKPYTLPANGAVLALDGRLLVADDKHLHWDGIDGPSLGTLEDSVVGLYDVPGGAMARLASGIAMYIAIGPGGTITIHHLSSSTMTATALTGRIFVPSSNGTEVIELPSRRRWVHPIQNPLPGMLSVSPDGTSLLELGVDGGWWQWTLPPARLEVEAIRHDATNAREQDDRVLLWPWQTSSTH